MHVNHLSSYEFINISVIIFSTVADVVKSRNYNPLGNLNSGRKPGERSSLEAAFR